MPRAYGWDSQARVDYGPFKNLLVAHCWVTDYPAPPCNPDGTGGFTGYIPGYRYWSCYSGPPYENGCRNCLHPGHGFGNYDYDVAEAEAICCPNDPNAYGGLGAWGKNGTCQQLTNRILWSAKAGPFGLAHPTCIGVSGWILSFLWFGPYGRTPWPPPNLPAAANEKWPIDFPGHLKAKVAEEFVDPILDMQEQLLSQKTELDTGIEGEIEDRQGYANTINGWTADFLWDVRQMIGDEGFQNLFDSPYEQGVIPSVLDPSH